MIRNMDGPVALVLSPDGRYLYTANQFSNDVSVFARDPNNGRVTFVGSLRNDDTDEAGNTIHGSNRLFIFNRNVADAKITLASTLQNGVADSSGTLVTGLAGANLRRLVLIARSTWPVIATTPSFSSNKIRKGSSSSMANSKRRNW
jgi:DNA-binding beta-propeller fold protein YncE